MRSGVPWQVQVRPEARETAREAARRSGMSVSEWLDSLIIDSASVKASNRLRARLRISVQTTTRIGTGTRRRSGANMPTTRRHRPVARDDRPEPAAYHDTSGHPARASAPRSIRASPRSISASTT